ncbi:MAG: hypothetical protein K1X55_14975 [Chitinophagales bacterium]|nr:hypothetical protein [Chitinophagales bacterium]
MKTFKTANEIKSHLYFLWIIAIFDVNNIFQKMPIMRKNTFLTLILLLFFSFNARSYDDIFEPPLDSYLNAMEEMNNVFNVARLSGSSDGDLKTVNKLIAEIDSIKYPIEYYMATLINEYSLLGKQYALNHLAGLRIETSQQIFLEAWMALVANDKETYEALIDKLRSYDAVAYITKLKHLELANDIFGSDNEQKHVAQSIEKILTSSTLSDRDRVYFSLAKCDMLERDDWAKLSIIFVLDSLYSKFPTYLNPHFLLSKIEECDYSACKELKIKLDPERNSKGMSAREQCLEYMSDIKLSKSFLSEEDEITPEQTKEIEIALTGFLQQAKDSVEQELIKGLITYKLMYQLSWSEDVIGMFFEPAITLELEFSESFQRLVSPKLQKPIYMDIINAYIDTILNNETFQKYADYDTEDLLKMKSELKTLTRGDLLYTTGMIQYVVLFYDEKLPYLGGFLDEAQKDAREMSWMAFKTYLEENPYHDFSYSNYPEVNSNSDILTAIQCFKNAKEQFPGAVNIRMKELEIIADHSSMISSKNLNEIVLECVKTIIELYAILPSLNIELADYHNDGNYPLFYLDKESLLEDAYYYPDEDEEKFDFMMNTLTASQRKEILTLIGEKRVLLPTQENLKKLESLVRNF